MISVLRTQPKPTDEGGLATLVALAISIVFNDSLQCVKSPYRGKYYTHDRLGFRKIWTAVAKEGHIKITKDLNLSVDYKETVESHSSVTLLWDDRWTCAGLAELLVHFGRALVLVALTWEDLQDFEDDVDDEGDEDKEVDAEEAKKKEDEEAKKKEEREYVKPEHVRDRVVGDLSDFLGLPRLVVDDLVGKVEDCRSLPVSEMLPVFEWEETAMANRSAHAPSLWDAWYAEKDVVVVDVDDSDMADDESEGSEFGKKGKGKAKAKAKGRKMAHKS